MEMYDVVERLSRGTFGTIYLCERKHNKRKLVIKLIHTDLTGDDLKNAKNEVAILKSLNHPNVIEYHDSYVKGDTFYIMMEYAEHGNLQEFIAKRRLEYLSPQAVMNFFCQILMGLDHIHEKGIIHRDLKCENIFLTGINQDVIKIGDFGIAKLLCNNHMAKTIIGTYNYVAPELCDGKPYDSKSDIWALGCILYELCQMEKLFEGTISNVVLSIANGKLKTINIKRYGKQMQILLNLLLQTDPKERPDTKTLMTLGDIFPTLHCLSVNLGCIF
ncbi:serine/threonine-protein kinase Nek8-like [Rhynchophorus ferrugineus]|uniref:non-specific serine/threonine protein kinase n=1 Tax=Rhynchophorus ferrugineus TaxID=354439 RepID=A0A834J399_RHYFE|nr:hypothetical protein GWI33_001697 [Rhynchophorus ferrugineus]